MLATDGLSSRVEVARFLGIRVADYKNSYADVRNHLKKKRDRQDNCYDPVVFRTKIRVSTKLLENRITPWSANNATVANRSPRR